MTDISSRQYLTGFHLKIIAMLTMLIDHIGAAVLENMMSHRNVMAGLNLDTFLMADRILRSIGRMAFPIYCFLLVEGFLHTSNRKKYFLLMGVFALVSEMPFDLAFFGEVVAMHYQNVFFTLAVGLLTMQGMEYAKQKLPVLWLLPAVAGIFLAEFLSCDYGGIGICLIVIFYYFHENRMMQCVVGALSFLWEAWSLPAFILLFFYNGERGQRINKYVFYAFYPVHLVVLVMIRYLLTHL